VEENRRERREREARGGRRSENGGAMKSPLTPLHVGTVIT